MRSLASSPKPTPMISTTCSGTLGYCLGIRSERRLCEEVHLNLAYRWFCHLDLTDTVPDHSTFSKNRHGRFRDSDLLRHLFETTVARCIARDTAHHDAFIRTRGQLAFLSPKIQIAIRDGTLPPEVTLKRMLRRPILLDWITQERMFGL